MTATLTEDELNLIRDAMLSHAWTEGLSIKGEIMPRIEHAIEHEDLAHKWGVNAGQLLAHLAQLSDEDWQAIKLEVQRKP